jgi:hypothetical protein
MPPCTLHALANNVRAAVVSGGKANEGSGDARGFFTAETSPLRSVVLGIVYGCHKRLC